MLTFPLSDSIIIYIDIQEGGFFMKKLKGFTLVELIVVMLILAILAGMFIPSMIGYIDKANESEIQIQTRQPYQAAQVISTENYKNGGFSCSSVDLSSAVTDNDKKIREFAKLSEINSGTVTVECDDSGKITKIIYSDAGKTCTFTPSERHFEIS